MPRRSQCVFGCDQFDVLHRFPKPDAFLDQFLRWKDIVGEPLEGKTNEDIYTNTRICNHHFEDFYFYPHSKRLARTANPTLKLGLNALLQDSGNTDRVVENSVEIQEQPPPLVLPSCSVSHIPDQTLTQKSGKAIRRRVTVETKKLWNKINILKNKLKGNKNEIKAAQKMSKTKLFCKIMKRLPVTTQTFMNMQLSQTHKKNRGRRFSVDEKLLALSIYKKSPKAYNFLKKMFTLPSKRTLQDVLKLIAIKPGLNNIVIDQIKDVVQNLEVERRLCVLMFDKMAISPSLNYEATSDRIIGFEDFGEIDYSSDNIADHVLVLMIKGIKDKYKQPVFYGFCKSATKAVVLKNILKNVIKELFNSGLIVVATVCDQAQINMKVVNDLIGETRSEYLRQEKEFKYNMFEVDNKKIFPLFDAPHLLKSIRNNLLTKNFRFIEENKIKVAKWEHLKLLLEKDEGEYDMRMCNKLTEAHVLPEKIPKMKVKHAAQVFSQRVSGALRFCARHSLLPQECMDTADVLLLFDQLFDSFNGGSYKTSHKMYKNVLKSNSEHLTLWNKAIPILRSMGFKTENKKRDGSTSITYEKVPCINNWIHNISTMKDLWQYLCNEYKVTSLLTRNLNQDPVENFFSSVRSHGVRNNNPTCLQFESIYKTLLINNLTSNHSLGANCEADENKILCNLNNILAKNIPPAPRSNEEPENLPSGTVISISQESECKLVTETRKYVAGFIIKKSKRYVCGACNTCTYELCETTPPQVDNYILCIDITKKSLQYPSQKLVSCVKSMSKIITYILKNYANMGNITKKMKAHINNSIQFDFLTCDKHKNKLEEYIKKMLINLIIHSWCRNINRILKGKHVKYDDDKVKIQAVQYFNMRRKNKMK